MSDPIAPVLAIFREQLNVEVADSEADLIEEGLLDSLGLVTLVVELEQQFGIRIPFETLEVDDFRTVVSIAALVAERRGPQG